MKYSHLAILSSPFISGAEISFMEFLKRNDKIKFLIVLPKVTSLKPSDFPKNHKITYLPLLWFKKSKNPFYYILVVFNILYVTFKINNILHNESIKVIYNNTFRAFIYSLPISIINQQLTNVCYIRDNISGNFLNNIILKWASRILCVSEFIYNQVPAPDYKKISIYNGIDIDVWKPKNLEKHKLREELHLDKGTILVAQIAQITRWKNQIDLIKASEIIIANNDSVHFLIIGSPYSREDYIFKKELNYEISKRNLIDHFTFLHFRNDIKEIIEQIDIIIHTAINEPFGKVVLEAMAMEKPVVAYNSGGLKEILVNGQTGYLVEPYNYVAIAKKTIHLILNKEKRLQFGDSGRKRVNEYFNILRYSEEIHQCLYL